MVIKIVSITNISMPALENLNIPFKTKNQVSQQQATHTDVVGLHTERPLTSCLAYPTCRPMPP